MAGSVVVLGHFDGVHSGHLVMLKAAVTKGIKERLISIACVSARKEYGEENEIQKSAQIMSDDIKRSAIKSKGIDKIVFIDFERERELSCEEFVDEILVGELSACFVICGESYVFSKEKGDAKMLEQLCGQRSIDVAIMPSFKMGNETVSSKRIQTLIEKGNMESASLLINFRIREQVLREKRQNEYSEGVIVTMAISQDIVKPKNGVYFSTMYIDRERYKTVTYVGTSPTVGRNELLVHTYIIGYYGNLSGVVQDVYFDKYYRGEKRFDYLDELLEQMEKDIEDRKKWNG